MIARRVTAGMLLAFVAFSLIQWAIKEHRLRTAVSAAFDAEHAATGGAATGRRQTVVFCFHGHPECDTCRTIAQCGREALEGRFARQLADGSLAWRVVDYAQPANRHFDEHYKLGSAPALVLAEFDGGRELRWKYLADVWNIVSRNDRPGLVAYICREMEAFEALANKP